MPTQAEALFALKEHVAKSKINAFDAAVEFANGNFNPEHAGYKSKEEAIIGTILRTNKDNIKLMRKYEKDFPD